MLQLFSQCRIWVHLIRIRSNIYLHYVLDLWAERWRRREATGDMIIVRYADDFIVGFQREADARRFWDDMRYRFEEFSLSLNPDKTRLIEFGRFAAERRAQRPAPDRGGRAAELAGKTVEASKPAFAG